MSGVDLDIKDKGTLLLQITWSIVIGNLLTRKLLKAAHAKGPGTCPPGKFWISYFFVDGILGYFGMIFINQINFNIAWTAMFVYNIIYCVQLAMYHSITRGS